EREQLVWNLEAERFCGLEVDHQFEPSRLHDRQVGRLRALENLTGHEAGLTMGVGPVYSVAHQAPGLRQIREIGNSRHSVAGCQHGKLLEPAAEENSTKNHECACLQ